MNGQYFRTPVAHDTTRATWSTSRVLHLSGRRGETHVWKVIDQDVTDDDWIGEGRFELADLHAAGGVAAYAGGRVTMIRFRLSPLGPERRPRAREAGLHCGKSRRS
ncbi:MAG: hypothetical protein R3F43_10095 [bacterium]